ncbi:BC1872 family protein [Paenibacillus sp. CAU 1782]
MTREQVLAMSAQELAEATAVHVMGWEIISTMEDSRNRKQSNDYPNGAGIIALYGTRYIARTGGRYFNWSPGEDISAAWEVEEAIPADKHKLYNSMLILIAGDGYNAVHASPVDRCKAALLAVMGI